jgi:hypothetical protein
MVFDLTSMVICDARIAAGGSRRTKLYGSTLRVVRYVLIVVVTEDLGARDVGLGRRLALEFFLARLCVHCAREGGGFV